MSGVDQWVTAVRRKPRDVVWTELRAKIHEYRCRGGDYLFWASQFEKHADEHRPTGPDAGAPCLTCAQLWPCPTIAGDLTPG